MVYVIAIVLGSSTHAWFASNNSVKAEKINVTATANVKFLEIQHAKGTIKKPLFLSPWFLYLPYYLSVSAVLDFRPQFSLLSPEVHDILSDSFSNT